MIVLDKAVRSIKEEKVPHLTRGEIYTVEEDIHNNEIEFLLTQESHGTQRIVELLVYIISALERGSVLLIDDVDYGIHSLVLVELINLFKERRYNTSCAQFIFTAHNTDIMDEDSMRISEIGLITHTRKRGTMLHRVSDFKGVRNVINFRRQYLLGVYGAIPFPYI
ncbi:MAG: AAA family ATPase [Sphaerochaetaceae bacterium]